MARRLRIGIVEDDPENLFCFKEHLKMHLEEEYTLELLPLETLEQARKIVAERESWICY